MSQLTLPIDIEIKLQKNDIAYVVNDLVKCIPDKDIDNSSLIFMLLAFGITYDYFVTSIKPPLSLVSE